MDGVGRIRRPARGPRKQREPIEKIRSLLPLLAAHGKAELADQVGSLLGIGRTPMTLFDYLDELRKASDEPGAYITISHEHEPDPRLLPDIDAEGKYPTADDRSDRIAWTVKVAPGWSSADKAEPTLTVYTDRQLSVLEVQPDDGAIAYAWAASRLGVAVES